MPDPQDPNLLQLLSEIRETRRVANVNSADFGLTTRAGEAMARRHAQDLLPDLEKRYAQKLRERSVLIVPVQGPHTAAFVTIARQEGALAVDVADLYGQIADRVERSIGAGREWAVTQYSMALDALLTRAMELGWDDLQPAMAKTFTRRAVPTRADVINAVHDVALERLGPEFGQRLARRALLQQAIDDGCAPAQSLGVVIVGARSEQEARDLMAAWPCSRATALNVTEAPTKGGVQAVFTAVGSGSITKQ